MCYEGLKSQLDSFPLSRRERGTGGEDRRDRDGGENQYRSAYSSFIESRLESKLHGPPPNGTSML